MVFDNLRELNVSVEGGFHARRIISYNQVLVMSEFSRFVQQTGSRQIVVPSASCVASRILFKSEN